MKLDLKILESRRLKFIHSIKKKKIRSSIVFKNEYLLNKYSIYFDQIVYSTFDPYFVNAFM